MGFPAYAKTNLLSALNLATDLIITGGEDPTFTRDNLVDADVANPFRSLSSAAFSLEFDLGSVQEFDLVSFHGHNFATNALVKIYAGPTAAPTGLIGSPTVEAGDFFFKSAIGGSSSITITDNWDTAAEWNGGTHTNTAVEDDALVLDAADIATGPFNVLLLSTDVTNAAATNTETALQNNSHTVVLSDDDDTSLGAITWANHDVVVWLRPATAEGDEDEAKRVNFWLRKIMNVERKGVVFGLMPDTSGTSIDTHPSYLHALGLVDTTASNTDNEIVLTDVTHAITSAFSAGALAVYSGSNFSAALRSGESHAGTSLATGDADGSLTGLKALIAIDTSDALLNGETLDERLVLGAIPFGGNSAYTNDGDDLLDRMVRWAFGAVYEASGTWQAATIALDGITSYTTSQVDVTSVTDSSSTVTVQARVGTYAAPGSWITVADGDPLPGISPGEDLTGKQLQIRVQLATSDQTVTPQVTSLSVTVSQTISASISARYIRIEVSGAIITGVAQVFELGELIVAQSVTLTSQFRTGFNRPVDEERIRHRTQRGVIKQRDLYNLKVRKYTFAPLSLTQTNELLAMHNLVRADPFVWIEDIEKTTILYGRKQDDFDCVNMTVSHYRVRLDITTDSKGVAITA